MIRQRKAAIDAYARREENSAVIKSEYEEIKSRLQLKYKRKEGMQKEVLLSRKDAGKAYRRSVRRAVHTVAGTAEREQTKQSIRRNLAVHMLETLHHDIETMENRANDLIRYRRLLDRALEDDRAPYEQEVRELKAYAASRNPDEEAAVDRYLDADRRLTLLEQVCKAGGAYYERLVELSKRAEGPARLAGRKLGKMPAYDRMLQDAYMNTGETWSDSAENLQILFMSDLRALETMTGHEAQIAGKIAFSELLFDTTLTAALTRRQGNKAQALLDRAVDETAQLLYDLEQEKADARTERDAAADAAGLEL